MKRLVIFKSDPIRQAFSGDNFNSGVSLMKYLTEIFGVDPVVKKIRYGLDKNY